VLGGYPRQRPLDNGPGRAQIRTKEIRPATAAIVQRMLGAEDPPEAQADEELAAAGRVLLEITIEKVAAVNYID
jgi:hypothetical protein